MSQVSGATAAGFNIVRLLGRGQIGDLYLVEHPRLPRLHALKILSAEVSADLDYRYRFKQASDQAATLWHPNIVGLHDRGEFENRLWLSMDYIDGTDAAELLTGTYPNGMPPDLVLEIVSAIADALDYAHEQGLVHGYVNPSNILLSNVESPRRRILLAGFGIARRPDEINSLTRANLGIGTVSYAAPEQLMNDSIDGRTDQYALAATAFHLLTGSPLFQHMNPAVLVSKHLNERPPRPSDVIPELIYFDAPFAEALMKSPNDRFPRCRDFAKALEARGSLKFSSRNSGVTAPETNGAAPAEPPAPPLPAAAAPAPPAAAVAPPPAAAAPAAPAAEVGDAVAPPDALPETEVDDASAFAEDDLWRATTDDTAMASRRRRRLHAAGLVLAIMTVAVVGLLGVISLRTASQSDDTPPNVETSSSVTTVPPARPAPPATAIPPPIVIPPAPATTMPPTPTPSLAATTAPPPTSSAPPVTTVSSTTSSTTRTHSPSPTTPTSPATPTAPAGLDTRPAIGMPCGPPGATATSNSGIPVACVDTPGGSAWEPPSG